MEKFNLINNDRSLINVSKQFEDISNPPSSIRRMEISYGCFCIRSIKPGMKASIF